MIICVAFEIEKKQIASIFESFGYFCVGANVSSLFPTMVLTRYKTGGLMEAATVPLGSKGVQEQTKEAGLLCYRRLCFSANYHMVKDIENAVMLKNWMFDVMLVKRKSPGPHQQA